MDSASADIQPVLCVDLDGTLYPGDFNIELGVALLIRRPWLGPPYIVWALAGRARLKAEIARRLDFSPSRYNYNAELLDWLRGEKAAGRRIVIASGADRRIVDAVAAHLGLFDEVFGSDGRTNLTGAAKAEALARRFGEFAYVGNSAVDLAVWRRAKCAYLVSRSSGLTRKLSRSIAFARVFASR